MFSSSRRLALIGAAALVVATPATAQEARGPVAAVSAASAGVSFQPLISGYESLRLTVTGPGDFVHEQDFPTGTAPSFSLFDGAGAYVADGLYTWELRAAPRVSRLARRTLESARASGAALGPEERATLGLPPAESLVQAGHFRVHEGGIVSSDAPEPRGTRPPKTASGSGLMTEGDPAPNAPPVSGDLTIYNSLCVGFDCASSESYGSDTIRLKENNLRIHFDDTSTAAGFPSTDWRLAANDNLSGGAGYFSIIDATANRPVFTIAAGAPSNAVRVGGNGYLGLGTGAPVVEMHSANGDTPTLRLDQNTSSGFAAQVWDVAGNETSFFVRDATNGSQLPFRIRPGADSNSLVINESNDIGVGILSPAEDLHVYRTSGEANLRLETTASAATEFQLANAGGEWQFIHGAGGAFNLNRVGVAGNQFVFAPNGSLIIQGSLTASGGATFPDYVFEPDYELMPLSELSDFVEREKHLPGVMSRQEVRDKGGVDVTRLQLQMLEKIEELTLHILKQDERIVQLEGRLQELQQTGGTEAGER